MIWHAATVRLNESLNLIEHARKSGGLASSISKTERRQSTGRRKKKNRTTRTTSIMTVEKKIERRQ